MAEKPVVVTGETCSVCGKENTELVKYKVGDTLRGGKVGLFFARLFGVHNKQDFLVCQSCVSKSFRAFSKKK